MIEHSSVDALTASDEEIGFRNPQLSVDDRVIDLLQRMTLEEKVAQMLCIWGQKKEMLLDEQGRFSPSKLEAHLSLGIGQIARISDTAGGKPAKDTAILANQIQKFFVERTRLGIPVIFHEECLHGLAGKDATSYPQPIGLGSTFNPALIQTIYSSIAEDVRSRGAHQALTPVVDVAREPRWGRVEETFGEDPYLVAQMGIAAVRGFQGDATFADKKHLIATLKHFAAHGQPESGSNCGPVNVSERVLRDTFFYTFYQVLKKANALSVMASYNEIDGVPSHANPWLLRDVLRKEWGFTGFVVSDYYAVAELHIREEAISHTVAVDKADAARLAVQAGVNIEFPDPDCYPLLVQLVKDGIVAESAIDELVAPLLRYKFVLGLFDDPYVDPELVRNDERLKNERALALTAAHETITLLKNDADMLPLNKQQAQRIAVIGPNANTKMLGGYSGEPKYYTSLVQGITEKVSPQSQVLYSEGCKLTIGGSWNEDAVTFADPEENKKLIREAVETARKADLVILAIGDNELTSREAWNKSHMGDRADLDLFGSQKDLVHAIAETGKPIVVVLFSGRPISITELQTQAGAILECWYL
ncbi:MAG TPA: glycoside hydrolase family 3 N-terminal domain-containing protein, partial [Bacteroidota bacterium]|nr:glycoside hydrolase family 3 N-terminal domain-containing protein [Bacteroidota bacterium]